MSKDPKMTKEIKNKLAIYEPKLKRCVKIGDIITAEKYMKRIQYVLKEKGYLTRLAKDRNFYYETLIEAGNITSAIVGLKSNKDKVGNTTRIYLETIALLSIAYIKKDDMIKAQKYINETILKINNITTDNLRRDFQVSFLERIENEILLNSLKGNAKKLEVEKVHNLSIELLKTKNVDEIYQILGESIPDDTVQILLTTHNNNILMIGAEDRKYLPKPVYVEEKKLLGKKFNIAIKRAIWKGLCDPNSEVYKAWSNGLSILHEKKYIACAVIAGLKQLNIGTVMIAGSIVALALRFGVSVFCEMFEPEFIMEKRKSR